MTLLDLVRLTRHNFMLLLVAAVVGVGLGAGYSALQPTVYAATATGMVIVGGSDSPGAAAANVSLATARAEAYVPLLQSRSVGEGIRRELQGGESPDAQALGLSGWVTGSALFKVTATSTKPTWARDLADAAIVATAEEAVRLESMQADGTSTGQSVVRLVAVEDAVAPGGPISPDWRRNMLAGAGLGLAVGFAGAFARRALDSRVRYASDVEELTGSATLGVVPRTPDLAEGGVAVQGGAGEALRQLRTNLRFVRVDTPPRAIVVTSANAGEGKSTVTAQLARLLAESGQPTVLIDADLRRPTQAERAGVDGTLGLTQVLAGDVPVADALLETATPGLVLLPAGRIPPNPSELVGSQRMAALLESLAATHTVLIDAPPILPVTDAGLLTSAADGAILVVEVGKARKEQVRLAAKTLERANGTVLGTVLNKAPQRGLGAVVYGYGYGDYTHDYYYSADGTKRKKARGPAPKRAAG